MAIPNDVPRTPALLTALQSALTSGPNISLSGTSMTMHSLSCTAAMRAQYHGPPRGMRLGYRTTVYRGPGCPIVLLIVLQSTEGPAVAAVNVVHDAAPDLDDAAPDLDDAAPDLADDIMYLADDIISDPEVTLTLLLTLTLTLTLTLSLTLTLTPTLTLTLTLTLTVTLTVTLTLTLT